MFANCTKITTKKRNINLFECLLKLLTLDLKTEVHV